MEFIYDYLRSKQQSYLCSVELGIFENFVGKT